MDQKDSTTRSHPVWSDLQPVPVARAADQYGVSVSDFEGELQRLGVPIHDFLEQRMFYYRDLHAAHTGQRANSGRVERTEHLARVLELLQDSGSTIEQHPRKRGRPSDLFTVRNAEDPRQSITMRVQVCSKIQSGGAIHFNIPTASRKQGVNWYWLVAPPFHPGWDFLFSSDDVGRIFGPIPDKKKLVTLRLKAEGFENMGHEHRLPDLLRDLHIGPLAQKRAQRKALNHETSNETED